MLKYILIKIYLNNPLMENLEDEIEFFGFLPITFTTDLQESLEEAFHDVMQNNAPIHSRIQSQILEALKRNIFIFNNFILRNILKFPSHYKYERKSSDKVIQENIQDRLKNLKLKQQELKKLVFERKELFLKLEIERNRNIAYKELLTNKNKYLEMIDAAKDIKKFLDETMKIYEEFKILNYGKNTEFENLLEFKNIKNIYYKEEKNRLFEIASPEVLEYFCKKLH